MLHIFFFERSVSSIFVLRIYQPLGGTKKGAAKMDDRNELRQRLIEDCDIEYICESVGVEMRQRGTATEVLCPFHDDQHFGNARIREKGIYCFACGRFYSVFDIVMKNMGISYFDAYKYVAEHTGDLSNYMAKSKKKIRAVDQFPLTKDELQFIGLADNRAKNILYYTDDKPKNKCHYDSILNDDGTWSYAVYENVLFTMRDVWDVSHAECIEILGDKTCEKADEVRQDYEEALKVDEYKASILSELLMFCVDIYRKLRKRGYKKKKSVLPVVRSTVNKALLF